MKKINLFAILVCCVLLIAYLVFKKESNSGSNSNEIKIGAIVPLTGSSALNGSMFKQGLEMAVNEINQSGGEISFTIVLEDSKSSPKDSYMAYKKLGATGIKYYAAFGGQFILSFAPDTKNTDNILFASAAPNSNLLQLTNRCFRLFPTVDMVTDKVRDYIVKNNYSRIAIVYMQNEAYSMYYNSLLNKLQEIGKDVVFVESYEPNCRDFKNIVSKMSSLQIDFLYSAGAGEGSALLTKQLYNNPSTEKIPVMGDMNFSNPDNLQIIGDIKSPIYTIENFITEDFYKNYQKNYNQSANGFSVYGYIIPYMLKEAILALGENATSNKVFDYIKTTEFNTSAGKVSFDKETGEPNLDIIVKTTYPK